MPDMVRNPVSITVRVGTSEANSEAFDFSDFAGGEIHIPSAETSQTLTFYAADGDGDSPTYNQKYDQAGTAISIATVADACYEMNPALFGSLKLKIVASAISSGTTVDYKVNLKS